MTVYIRRVMAKQAGSPHSSDSKSLCPLPQHAQRSVALPKMLHKRSISCILADQIAEATSYPDRSRDELRSRVECVPFRGWNAKPVPRITRKIIPTDNDEQESFMILIFQAKEVKAHSYIRNDLY